MDQHKVEKFLNNTCTPEEAKQVVEWFATREGQVYLAKRLDKDAGLLQDNRIRPILAGLSSAGMWKGIEAGMGQTKRYNSKRVVAYWYVAAVILVAGTFFYHFLLARVFRQANSQKQTACSFYDRCRPAEVICPA